jgi:hypothetical protein
MPRSNAPKEIDYARVVDSLPTIISELLINLPPTLQSCVLADALGCFLAKCPAELRETILAEHIKLVRDVMALKLMQRRMEMH